MWLSKQKIYVRCFHTQIIKKLASQLIASELARASLPKARLERAEPD
jgi:hypothetical protein